jgi:putative tricarboxylic transport membrane protein
MILGRMLERSVQQALTMSGGDLAIFIQKPISAGLLVVAAFVLLSPAVRWLWAKRRILKEEVQS